jgi:CHASE2 domain-containing sensor protein
MCNFTKELQIVLIIAVAFTIAAIVFICLALFSDSLFHYVMAMLWFITAIGQWIILAYRSRKQK